MRKYLLFVLIICSYTTLFSQDRSAIPFDSLSKREGIDETNPKLPFWSHKYMIGTHKNGKLKYIWSTDFIHPILNDHEIIGTGPWEGNITISPSSINYETITKEVFMPYYKIADSCAVHMAAYYDLSGNFLKFEIEIPTEVEIPLKAIEILDSRLRKESKLQLEYDPEKAKYVNFITLSNIPIYKPSYGDSKIEYEEADSNTYAIEYYKDRKYISNANNPYEGIGTGNWRQRIDIISLIGDPDVIAKKILAPYWKKKYDWYMMSIRVIYDLNGDLQYFTLGIPSEVNIPIKVIEKLEYRLKKKAKLILEPNPDPERAKYVNYIVFP